MQFQIGKSSSQPQRIELIDGECSDAALCAPRAADQPLAAAARRLSQGGVHDLNQFLIFDPDFGSWRMTRHGDA
jgi:hypothetical protein